MNVVKPLFVLLIAFLLVGSMIPSFSSIQSVLPRQFHVEYRYPQEGLVQQHIGALYSMRIGAGGADQRGIEPATVIVCPWTSNHGIKRK
jgi:hypothetical protein